MNPLRTPPERAGGSAPASLAPCGAAGQKGGRGAGQSGTRFSPIWKETGAGEGIRTLDPNLGKIEKALRQNIL